MNQKLIDLKDKVKSTGIRTTEKVILFLQNNLGKLSLKVFLGIMSARVDRRLSNLPPTFKNDFLRSFNKIIFTDMSDMVWNTYSATGVMSQDVNVILGDIADILVDKHIEMNPELGQFLRDPFIRAEYKERIKAELKNRLKEKNRR